MQCLNFVLPSGKTESRLEISYFISVIGAIPCESGSFGRIIIGKAMDKQQSIQVTRLTSDRLPTQSHILVNVLCSIH